MVEVILLKSTGSLGDMGQVVRVSSGYARNYLIPNKIALPSTTKLVKQFEHRKRLVQAKILKTRGQAETLASKINKIKIQFTRKTGDQGKLFGSVTSSDIAEALLTKQIEIDRKQVLLSDGPLKEIGNHKVDIRLFQDIKGKVLVEVRGDSTSESDSPTKKDTTKKKSTKKTSSDQAGSAASAT